MGIPNTIKVKQRIQNPNNDGAYDYLYPYTASDVVEYDNTLSGLTGSTVKLAIDEIADDLLYTVDELLTSALPRDADTLGGQLPSYYAAASATVLKDGSIALDDITIGNRLSTVGVNSFAQGYNITASGDYSHAQNIGTIASGSAQTVMGKYNVSDSNYALIVGNGISDVARSNGLLLDWSGNLNIAGTLVTTGAPVVDRSTSYTLALSDRGTLQKCASASEIVVTIPLNANVTFPLYTEITFVEYGTGNIKFTPASGVSLLSADGKRSIDKQYQTVVLKKMGTNEWLLVGALTT